MPLEGFTLLTLWKAKINNLVDRAINEQMKPPLTIKATDRFGNPVGVDRILVRPDVEIRVEGTPDLRTYLPFHAMITDSSDPPKVIFTDLEDVP